MKIKGTTYRDVYGPAMWITDPAEAKEYFKAMVDQMVDILVRKGETQDVYTKARQTVLFNLGYYAGYYDPPIRQRVEKLYGAVHPVFGKSES